MKKYVFIIFISIFVIGYFLFGYLKEESSVLESPQTEESQSNINQGNNSIESYNLDIIEPYLDEKNIEKIYVTFLRMAMLDEPLKKEVEWVDFSNLLKGYSAKLEKDNDPIDDLKFTMYFFDDWIHKGDPDFDKNYLEKYYAVKYYTVLYKTPLNATFQDETVEFDALSVTYDTISNRFILYLKNGDKLTPYIINEDPTQFLQLYDKVDINTRIEG